MVELKDLSRESTGRHAAVDMQVISPSTCIEAPLKKIRGRDEIQIQHSQYEISDDSGRVQVSVSLPRVERTNSPLGTRPSETKDTDLEHECDTNHQLKCNRCKCFSEKAKSSANNDNNLGAECDGRTHLKPDDPTRGKMNSSYTNANSTISINHQQDVAEQQDRRADVERRLRPQKYCSVCGDRAIACNFNAVTCESCKAFFRRNAFKEQRLRCLFENRCVIDRVTRRFCSKCRLLKCLKIGMKREWILTEEQKQIKRVKIMQNKQSRQQQVSTTQTNGNSSGSDETTESSGTGETPRTTEMRSAEFQERPGKRHVQTRDASVSCPDESDLATGLVLAQCSFLHQCQYCSLRLGVAGPSINLADHLQPSAHNHHHQPVDQQVFGQLQPRPPQSYSQRHPHPYHYPQQAAAMAYTSHPQPNIHAHPHHHHHNMTQARPLSPSRLAAPTGSTTCYNMDSTCVTVHRANGPELIPHQHHYNTQPSCTGVIVDGSSQSSLQVASSLSSGRECCCLAAATVKVASRAPTCHIEPATSTTNGGGGQLSEGGGEIAAGAPHMHVLSQPRESSSCSMVGSQMAFGATQNDCADRWPAAASDNTASGSGASDKPAVEAQPMANCTDQGQNFISSECDAAAQTAAAGVYSQSPSSDNLIEWKGELFVKPAFSEQETWDRINQLELAQSERQLILEMMAANKQILDIVEKPSNDSALDDMIFCLDVALKSLIKNVKKISAFRMLSMDDQIVLLKNACFKILLVRSCLYYNDHIGGWVDRFGNVKYLRVLKSDMCHNYERHKELLEKLARPLRRDRLIIMFIIMIVLFDPKAHGLKSANSIELDNLVYLSALRKYLLASQPEPLAKYERLVEALRVINVCNEEYNLFFSRKYQPEQITPLLIEIFDISVNSPTR